ncbi:MAG: VCBS repeat-containing protein [Nitrospinae bacterium]|nr:VCBS repeat-containing protein [Nitrospinota bacterium]
MKTSEKKKNTLFCAVLLFLFFFGFPLAAQAATGLDWLATQQNMNGGFGNTPASLTTSVQSTAEVLKTYQALGEQARSPYGPALAFLNNNTEINTEYLSRKIMVNSPAGNDISLLVSALFTHQNPDSGFGGFPDYESAMLDTAFALKALAASGQPAGPSLSSALAFLSSRQQTDGGWTLSQGEPGNVYLTALALNALSRYKTIYNLQATIDKASAFLFSTQNADGGFNAGPVSTVYESALAFIALVESGAFTPANLAAAQRVLNYLTASQQINGSWNDDPYSTALALRALAMVRPNLSVGAVSFSNPTPNPGETVTITAQINNTGLAAANSVTARFSILDSSNNAAMIGETVIPVVSAGLSATASIVLDATGYSGSQVILVQADPGDLIQEANEADNESSEVLQIVSASVNQPPRITSAPSSSATVNTLYTYDVDVADPDGGPITYSLLIAPAGMAIDPATGLITWTPGSTQAGDHRIVVGTRDPKGGADSQSFIISVDSGAPGANHPPAITSTPISHATVGSSYSYQIMAGDADGDPVTYTLSMAPQGMNIDPASGLITWTPAAAGESRVTLYARDGRGGTDSQSFIIVVSLSSAGPDLVAAAVDKSGASTDTQTLEITGTVGVRTGNAGDAATPGAFSILLFEDRNLNGLFDAGGDPVLGSAEYAAPLASGEQVTVPVNISGAVLFRDNLIHAWVDSGNAVAEADESNNITDSGRAGRFYPPPGPLSPVLKWWWKRSAVMPSHDQVMCAPAVANLTDDNGDGKIDANDIPDVIFNSYNSNYQTNGVLRAVSGADGREIFTAAGYTTIPGVSPAVGDIDGDGLPEIIVMKTAGWYPSSAQMLAFEHDGTLKWETTKYIPTTWYGSPAIADLNGDGQPEIIVGATVIDSKGAVLWKGGGGTAVYTSLAADLDLDGTPEVVAGNTAYRANGTIFWRNAGVGDGYNAVGNFDSDRYPEIVVVAGGYVWLLEHDGSVKWGPVFAGYGGDGGPPTVADFDGDGAPEIGVAGGRHYVVFETDGGVRWLSPTNDESSAITGSTVFDFEGDGSAEVLYGDQDYLRVYKGSTGEVLFSTRNPSGTKLEYPVVADVDNDGQAEIVVVSNQLFGGVENGVRVFESKDGDWANTRRIWNQHTYHVTNVNEDGTIPARELNNWEIYNNYRANVQLSAALNLAPDVTASFPRIGQADCPASADVTVRIGNGGGVNIGAGTKIAFYDISSGSTLLGTARTTGPLAPGTYEDVAWTWQAPTAGTVTLMAAADDDGLGAGRVNEGDENNNAAVFAADACGSGAPVSTNNPPSITSQPVTAASIGAPYVYDAAAGDPDGDVLAYALLKGPAGMAIEPSTGRITWAPGAGDAGSHAVYVAVRDGKGGTGMQTFVLAVAGTSLSSSPDVDGDGFSPPADCSDGDPAVNPGAAEIMGDGLDNDCNPGTPDSTAGFLFTSRLTADKVAYRSNEAVMLSSSITNQARPGDAFTFADLRATVTISDAQNLVVHSGTVAGISLVSGAVHQSQFAWNTGGNPPGTYKALLEVKDASGSLLSTVSTAFEIQSTRLTGAGLVGSLTPSPRILPQLKSLNIEYAVTNLGNEGVPGLNLKVLIGDPESGRIYYTLVDTAENLQRQGTYQNIQTIPMLNLPVTGDATTYLVVLRAVLSNGVEVPLAGGPITVTPALKITKEIDKAARVLLWLGKEKKQEDDDEGAPAGKGLFRTVLDQMGLYYTIVHDKNDFRKLLRSNRYNLYIIGQGHEPLMGRMDEELAEQVNAGTGLITARWKEEEKEGPDLFGMKFKGFLNKKTRILSLHDSPITQQGAIAVKGKVAKVEIREGSASQVAAEIRDKEGKTCPGLVMNQYGDGRAVFFAFDPDESRTAQNEDTLMEVIKNSIQWTSPQKEEALLAGGIIPVKITVKSLGFDGNMKLREVLPEGTEAIGPLGWARENDASLSFEFTLGIGQEIQKRVFIRAPRNPGDISLTTEVYYKTADNAYGLYDTVSLKISVQGDALKMLLDAREILSSINLPSQKAHEALDKILDLLASMQGDAPSKPGKEEAKSWGENIHETLKAIKELFAIEDEIKKASPVDAVSLEKTGQVRSKLDQLLRLYEIMFTLAFSHPSQEGNL